MFLSQLRLNARCDQVRRDLACAYEMHRTLMRAFPSAHQGGAGRVLFRVEPRREGEPPIVLVQSEKQPDWSDLLEMGYAQIEGPKPINPAFLVGQRLRFRLRANPTVRRENKRHGLVNFEDQTAWLRRKGEACGFQPLNVMVARTGRYVNTKHGPEGRQRQVHLAVDFEGVLAVTDVAKFTKALASGIGPAKGYGFGLLSVARA